MGKKGITETDIIGAIDHCNSFRELAVYLRTHRNTLNKYCNLIINTETGKSYYEYIKHKYTKNKKISTYVYSNPALFHNMIAGECSHINYSLLKRNLISHGYFDNMCSKCGFSEVNITNDEIPLVLVFIDGNRKNTHISNLDLTCMNCYGLMYDTFSSTRNGIIKINGYV